MWPRWRPSCAHSTKTTNKKSAETRIADRGQTFLIPENSPFHRAAEIDRPGVRIVVNRATPADAQLTRLVQEAELIRSDVPGTGAAELLFAGEADAYGFNREALLGLMEQRSSYRVVEDNFAVTELGTALTIDVWGASGPVPRAEEHLEQLRAAVSEPGVTIVDVPVNTSLTRKLVDAAGAVVAWSGLPRNA